MMFRSGAARRRRDFDCGYAAALVEMNRFVRQHFKKVVPKRRFASEADARAFLVAHSAAGRFSVYHCALCDGWHFATVRDDPPVPTEAVSTIACEPAPAAENARRGPLGRSLRCL